MKRKPYFAYRSFWPELDTMRRMRECGVDTICFFAANTRNSLGEPYCLYPSTWLWYDRYDFTPLERQIEDILAVCPDARLICMIDLNAPEWLVKNRICQDSFGELGRVMCDPQWRELTGSYLEAFLRHAESRYASRIDAYVLAGGKSCEWMDFSRGTESPSKTRAFQSWCRRRGFPVPEDIPPPSQREHLSHDGTLRDPETDLLSLRYWRFCSEAVAETIKYFVDRARTVIPDSKQLGVFYGYAIELHGDRFLSLGHLGYEQVLDLPGLDFLISPGTYRDRAMGGGSGFMAPIGTVRLKGKSLLHECDQRTHTYNSQISPHVRMEFPHWPDEPSTLAGLRREMALALIHGASLWWFDMWGGFYQGETIYENFRHMKAIWDRFAGRDMPPAAEVAWVIDPDGCYYLHPTDARAESFRLGMQDDSYLHGVRDKLNRLGAPYDVFSMNDLGRMPDLDRYKCLILSTPFEITPTKEAMLRDKVLKGGRTVVWLSSPGVSNGHQWMPERVESFCGVPYGTPGVTQREMKAWRSVHVAEPAGMTLPLLKQLVAESGATVYCDEPIPVMANQRLVAIHSDEGGWIEVRLPFSCGTITELFSNQTAGTNTNTFEFLFPSPGTCLFELQS